MRLVRHPQSLGFQGLGFDLVVCWSNGLVIVVDRTKTSRFVDWT